MQSRNSKLISAILSVLFVLYLASLFIRDMPSDAKRDFAIIIAATVFLSFSCRSKSTFWSGYALTVVFGASIVYAVTSAFILSFRYSIIFALRIILCYVCSFIFSSFVVAVWFNMKQIKSISRAFTASDGEYIDIEEETERILSGYYDKEKQ